MVLLDAADLSWSGSRVVASRRLLYQGGETIAPMRWGVTSFVQLTLGQSASMSATVASIVANTRSQ